jgi:hypothetical protein
MRFTIKIMTIFFLFFFIANSAHALKCKNTFIKPGLQSIAIEKTCGEPRAKEVVNVGGKSGKITERWTYGPYHGYFYLLYFKGGTLEKVESIRQ